MPRSFPIFSDTNDLLFNLDHLGTGVFWARSWPNQAAGGLSEREQWENTCNPAYLDAALLRLPDGRWCRCIWEHVRGRRFFAGRLVTARCAAELLEGPEYALPPEWQELLAADLEREGQRVADVLERERVERVRREAPPPPPDGDIRDGYVYAAGAGLRLTEQLRNLLSFLLRNNGTTVEAVNRHMGFTDNPHLQSRLTSLRNKLKLECKRRGLTVRIQTTEGHVHVTVRPNPTTD